MYTKQKGTVPMSTVNYLWPTLAVPGLGKPGHCQSKYVGIAYGNSKYSSAVHIASPGNLTALKPLMVAKCQFLALTVPYNGNIVNGIILAIWCFVKLNLHQTVTYIM